MLNTLHVMEDVHFLSPVPIFFLAFGVRYAMELHIVI